jgi:hypothetical protein
MAVVGIAMLARRAIFQHVVPVPGPDQLGGYCNRNRIGRQNVENPCVLPLAFLPSGRSGPVRMYRRGIASLNGRRPQPQTLGLELADE